MANELGVNDHGRCEIGRIRVAGKIRRLLQRIASRSPPARSICWARPTARCSCCAPGGNPKWSQRTTSASSASRRPAFSNGQIFIRTDRTLYAIGNASTLMLLCQWGLSWDNCGMPRLVWPFLCLLCLGADTKPREAVGEGWSRFRGPNGSGVSTDQGFPAVFGKDKNIAWRTSVRQGKSSPILTQQHIFLTAFEQGKLYTQCFDRKTGKLLWERSVDKPHSGNNEPVESRSGANTNDRWRKRICVLQGLRLCVLRYQGEPSMEDSTRPVHQHARARRISDHWRRLGDSGCRSMGALLHRGV